MGENLVILLVNLNYGDDESGHILYQVRKNDVDAATKAIGRAYDKWFTAIDGTIEDFIEAEFKESHINAVCREYENIDLDMSNY